jgi:hypothetical protein
MDCRAPVEIPSFVVDVWRDCNHIAKAKGWDLLRSHEVVRCEPCRARQEGTEGERRSKVLRILGTIPTLSDAVLRGEMDGIPEWFRTEYRRELEDELARRTRAEKAPVTTKERRRLGQGYARMLGDDRT